MAPFTNIPNRSHKASASSIECAESIKPRYYQSQKERTPACCYRIDSATKSILSVREYWLK
jgi:hypothetical protein